MTIDLPSMKAMPWYQAYPKEIRETLEGGYTLPVVSFDKALESSARYYPDTTALVYEPENFIVSYAELLTLSRHFAAGLQTLFSLKKGEKVAIYSKNCPAVAISIMGIAIAGGVYVACNTLLIKKEVAYQLKDSGSRTIVVSSELLPVVKEIVEEKSTDLENVIVVDWHAEMKPSWLQSTRTAFEAPWHKFSEILMDKPLTDVPLDPLTDLLAIIYTSGTTSYPKGVMLSHYNAVSAGILYGTTQTGQFPVTDEAGLLRFRNHPRDLSQDWDFPIRNGIDWLLSVPPWSHAMGFIGRIVYPIMSALTIMQLPVFNIDTMLSAIQRYRIASCGGAPMMVSTMLSRDDIDHHDITCIKAWASGGAQMPVAVSEKFEEKISGFVSEAWCLTETAMASTKNYANRSGIRKAGSVGIPLPFTMIKVVDIETGTQEMPLGEEGELIQKGPSVALGYLNREEDSKQTFRDGWLHSGDIGKMDTDGFFYITGRKKELIKYKGYNIAPRMLEDILYKHPAVYMCAALGRKDEVVGEIPVAFVQLKEGYSATPEELMAFVNEQVAYYKKLREIIFVEDMPLLISGKLNRRELSGRLTE